MHRKKNMHEKIEMRKHFRISPPAHLVKEFAIWFCAPHEVRVLPLEELNMADLLSINGFGSIRVENISAGGICFSMTLADLGSTERLKRRHCYVFLKLRRPHPGKHAQYCLFLGISLLQATVSDGRIRVRGKVTTRGMPASTSKSFQLFNVERGGIRDLAVWCEEIDRMGRGIMPPLAPGLDMEYLLLELSVMQPKDMDASDTPSDPPAQPAQS